MEINILPIQQSSDIGQVILVPIIISLFALAFSVLAFWYSNWRKGHLEIADLRAFGAGKGSEGNSDDKNLVIITLPLLIHNNGAQPVIIESLRLVEISSSNLGTLRYEANDHKLHNPQPEDRDYFFLPQAIKPNEVINSNFVFQISPIKFDFKKHNYKFKVQAQIAGAKAWKTLKEVSINFSNYSNIELFNLNVHYDIYPYTKSA